MAQISVVTTSTSFGLLPSDLNQFGNWINQYGDPSATIYQDEANVMSGMLTITNDVDAYVATHGASFFGLLNANELELDTGTYKIDYYGTFSNSSSQVSKIFFYDSASGISATQTGNFLYPGNPAGTALESGSTITGATDLFPNPAAPSSDLIDVLSLNASYNGSYWSGYVTGYSEAISDTTNNKMVQINVFENPTTVSFAVNTPSTLSFLNFTTSTVDGAGIQVSDYATGTVSDSVLITGFSFAANSVAASQLLSTAVAGSDSITLSGTGDLNALSMLNNGSVKSVAVSGPSNSIAVNLDELEALEISGKLTSITQTDTNAIGITYAQLTDDSSAVGALSPTYELSVSEVPPDAVAAVEADPHVVAFSIEGTGTIDGSTGARTESLDFTPGVVSILGSVTVGAFGNQLHVVNNGDGHNTINMANSTVSASEAGTVGGITTVNGLKQDVIFLEGSSSVATTVNASGSTATVAAGTFQPELWVVANGGSGVVNGGAQAILAFSSGTGVLSVNGGTAVGDIDVEAAGYFKSGSGGGAIMASHPTLATTLVGGGNNDVMFGVGNNTTMIAGVGSQTEASFASGGETFMGNPASGASTTTMITEFSGHNTFITGNGTNNITAGFGNNTFKEGLSSTVAGSLSDVATITGFNTGTDSISLAIPVGGGNYTTVMSGIPTASQILVQTAGGNSTLTFGDGTKWTIVGAALTGNNFH